MANKAFIKNFINFKGLNTSNNTLTRTQEYAETFQNFQVQDDGSIGLRQGETPKTTTGVYAPDYSGGLGGIIQYDWFSTADGSTNTHIIAYTSKWNVTQNFMLLSKNNAYLTLKCLSGTATLSIFCNPSTKTYQIQVVHSVLGTQTLDIGDGGVTDPSSGKSLRDFMSWLVNLGGVAYAIFDCEMHPSGYVDGNQTAGWNADLLTKAYSGTALVPRSTSDLTAGMSILFHATSGGVQKYPMKISYCQDRLSGSPPVKIGSTIRWTWLQSNLSFADNDFISPIFNGVEDMDNTSPLILGLFPATSIALGGTNFYFDRWGLYQQGNNQYGSTPWTSNYSYPNQKPWSYVNLNNCVYLANQEARHRGILKHDGRRIIRAGLPALTYSAVTNTNTSTLAQYGIYYFYWQMQHTDNRGNIIDGPLNGIRFANPSDSDPFLLPEPLKVSMTASTDTGCTITLAYPENRLAGASDFGYRYYWGAKISSYAAKVITLTGSANHKFMPGDGIWCPEGGTAVYRTVVNATATTIEVDSAFTYDSAWPYVSIAKVRLFRTVDRGTKYYLAVERPMFAVDVTAAMVNATTDANLPLNEELDLPLSGEEHDAPRSMTTLTTHQGLLVGALKNEPNTVGFSLPTSPEYMPLSQNYFDIPSGVKGEITALASDTDSMMMVAKKNGIYNVTGDLATLSFTISPVTEKDIGCPSQAALVRIKSALIFPSYQGFFLYRAGTLDETFNQRLISYFRNQDYPKTADNSSISTANQSKLVIEMATAINDVANQRYICFIPALTGGFGSSSHVYPNTNSKWFIWQYYRDTWSTATGYQGGGTGMTVNALWGFADDGEKILFVAERGRSGQIFQINNYGDSRDFQSVANTIPADLVTYFESLDEPSLYKQWLRAKLYSIRSALNSFSLRLTSYLDYDSTNFNSAANTDSVVNFNNVRSAIVKMINTKALSLALRIRNHSDTSGTLVPPLQQCILTGYEVAIDANYKKEDIVK